MDRIVRYTVINATATGLLTFALLYLIPSGQLGWFRAALLVGLALVNYGWYFLERAPKIPGAPQDSGGPDAFGRFMRLLVVGVILIAVVFFWYRVFRQPQGQWDAWGWWLSKARIIVLTFLEGRPVTLYVPSLPHLEYPTGIVLLVSAVSLLYGAWQPILPAAVHFGLFVAYLLLLYDTARQHLKRPADFWILALMILVPTINRNASDQCADFPLSFFMAFAASRALRIHAGLARTQDYLLFGIASGVLLNLKNEGAYAAMFTLLFGVLAGAYRGTLTRWLAAGIPLIALWLLRIWYRSNIETFEVVLGPPDEIVRFALDPARYAPVLRALLDFHLGPLALLAGIVLIRARGTRCYHLFLPWLGLHGLYNAFFVITHLPQQWHMDTALVRINMQIAPAFFVVALYVLGRAGTGLTGAGGDLQLTRKLP